jgi:hypothetical protein
MFDLEHAKSRIFDRVHRTGEQVKNDLPKWVDRVVKSEAWKKALDASGKPFATVGEWLVSNYPLGPGVGQGRYTIKYEELISLCEDNFPELMKLLKDSRPKRKNGRPSKEETVDNVNSYGRSTGNSRQYIEERLQREHKAIWKDYLAGKYKSARQAGIAAGFVRDGHNPADRLRSYWKKADKKQRKEFLKWIESEDAK